MIEWIELSGLINYENALDLMKERMNAIAQGDKSDTIFLLEHPPLYTAGRNADANDLLAPDKFPVYQSERGGQYTYHGPGQRIAYLILDLKKRGKHRHVRELICRLEEWIILTLADFGIKGQRLDGSPGIWITTKHETGLEITEKIAALGIKVKNGITYHGIAINVCPNLSHFDGIVPCGINNRGVTSFEKLGITATLKDVDKSLQNNFNKAFDGFI